MSLTYNGKHLVDVLPSKDINALVYCAERVVIPPCSNAQVVCSVPRLRQKAHLGKMFLFEPTYRHLSRYAHCDTYEGVVTTDDQMIRYGSFNIIMTNNSARHTMIYAHDIIGMLKSIDNTQVCTIHKTFHDSLWMMRIYHPYQKRNWTLWRREREVWIPQLNPNAVQKPVKNVFDQITKKANTKPKLVEKEFYHIPMRNYQTGKIEVNTLLKEETSPVVDMNKIGPQEHFVSYKKPELSDAPIDKKTTLDLEIA